MFKSPTSLLTFAALSLTVACNSSTEDPTPVDSAQDTNTTEDTLAPRNLVAVGYNDETQLNEVYSIDVETAEVTTLHSFAFDSGSWWPGIVSDIENGVFYCVSMAGTLYRIAMDGSSVEAIGQLTQEIQNMNLGNGELIAIGYNAMTDENVLRTINLETAEVSDVKSFKFESGSWELNITPYRADGHFFVTDTDHNLYRIQMDGSAIDIVGQFGPHVFFGQGQDHLAGIVFNDETERYEVVSLSTEVGEITVLNDFKFNTKQWQGYVVTDPDAGVFYGLSNTQTLYRFHMDDGTKEKIAPLSQSIQAMGLGLPR